MFDSSRNVIVFPSELQHIFDMQNDSPKLPIKRLLAFSTDQAKAIADYRFEQRLRSEREAVRRLIALGLAAAASNPKRLPSDDDGPRSFGQAARASYRRHERDPPADAQARGTETPWRTPAETHPAIPARADA
jgi:hypothetical protein